MEKEFAADIEAVAAIEAIPPILDVICRITGLGFAAVARVTEQRWITCAVRDQINFGLKVGDELKVETTICNEIRQHGQIVVVDHVSDDPQYCRHPTPAMYGFQSYISVPVKRQGEFFGTLCAIDPRPAQLNRPEVIQMVTLFADLIGMHLDASARLAARDAELHQVKRDSGLREEFIAVLGHDLRNPLAAIDTTALVLLADKNPTPPFITEMALRIRKSSARMAVLISNLMDFARGRMGGGIELRRDVILDLDATLEQVVLELRTLWREREIRYDILLELPVSVDSGRIAQLLSNLLANAISYGLPDHPVVVEARSDEAGFRLIVANQGNPIPAATMANLFQPFAGGRASRDSGLGLGLYIASEIAKAHGGTLSVESTAEETRFTFAMPADRS